MSHPGGQNRWIVGGIALALLLWGLVLGLGAALEIRGDEEADWRKLVVVWAATACFLCFWGAALWVRSWRSGKASQATLSSQPELTESTPREEGGDE